MDAVAVGAGGDGVLAVLLAEGDDQGGDGGVHQELDQVGVGGGGVVVHHRGQVGLFFLI